MKNTFLYTALFAALFALTGCQKDLSQVQYGLNEATPTASRSAFDIQTPHLLHVDERARVATIRNGEKLNGTYLVAYSKSGQEIAILKKLPRRSEIALYTADILEGEPVINSIIKVASSERSAQLAEIYSDAEGEI